MRRCILVCPYEIRQKQNSGSCLACALRVPDWAQLREATAHEAELEPVRVRVRVRARARARVRVRARWR
eukprot:377628-Pleurochrysis_carterae.AAC.1